MKSDSPLHPAPPHSASSRSARLPFLLGLVSAALLGSALLGFLGSQEKIGLSPLVSEDNTLPEAHGLSASYLSGRYAAGIQDYKNASLYLTHALQLDPQNKEMMGYAYRMRLVAGDMEEATKVARERYEAGDRDSNPEIMTLISYIKEGDTEKARGVLEAFDKAGFNLLVVPLFHGWLDYKEGKLKAPLQLEGEMTKTQDFQSFVSYQMALINDAAGFSAEAEKQYELAMANPKSLPLRGVEMLANFYARTEQWAKLALLKEQYHKNTQGLANASFIAFPAEGSKPERLISTAAQGIAEILFSTAGILNMENLGEEALIYVQQALYLNPDLLPAQLMRGALLEGMERYEEAIAAYNVLPKSSPYYLHAQLRKAYAFNETGREKESLALLKKLSGKEEARYDAEVAMGDIAMQKKLYIDAEKAYNAALVSIKTPEKHHWPVYYARGISRERQGKWATAEEDFLIALKLQPDQPDVLNYLGYSWITQGKNLEKATNMIETAVAARPTDAHILDSMGWAFYAHGKYEDAIDYLERAIELMPTDSTVNHHLGDAYWRMGRHIEARFQWKRVLLFKPDDKAQEQQLADKLQNGLSDNTSPPKAAQDGAAAHAAGS